MSSQLASLITKSSNYRIMVFFFFKFFWRFNIHLLTVKLFQYMSNEQKINVKIKKRPLVCCFTPKYFNTFLKSYDQPWGPRLAKPVACTMYRGVLKKHTGNLVSYFNWYIQQWDWITELNQIRNLVLSL